MEGICSYQVKRFNFIYYLYILIVFLNVFIIDKIIFYYCYIELSLIYVNLFVLFLK